METQRIVDTVDGGGTVRCGGCGRVYGLGRSRACCRRGIERPRARRLASGLVLYPAYAADGTLRFVSVPK